MALQGQDAVFSQYFTNKLYLNPAFAGFEGGTVINTNYRIQWPEVAGANSKFDTRSVGVSTELGRVQSGLGLLYMDQTAGEGFLRWQSISAAYAWRNRRCGGRSNDKYELSLGLKVSYHFYSFNRDGFLFSDQLHPIDGVVRPTAFPGIADPSDLGRYWDFDFGALLELELGDEDHLRIGGAVNHFVRVDPSVEALDDTLGMRFTFHATWIRGRVYGTSVDKYLFVPMLRIEAQPSTQLRNMPAEENYWYTTVDYGVAFSMERLPGFFGGLWHRSRWGLIEGRNTNSFTVMAGTVFSFDRVERKSQARQTYRLAFSYDYNYGGLRSDGGGTYEFSLIIDLSGRGGVLPCGRKGKRPQPPCPIF